MLELTGVSYTKDIDHVWHFIPFHTQCVQRIIILDILDMQLVGADADNGAYTVLSRQKKTSHHHQPKLTVFLMNAVDLIHVLSPLADEKIEISLVPPTCRGQLWTWKFGKRMEVDIVCESTHIPGKEATESNS